MPEPGVHIPVLMTSVLNLLAPQPGDTYVDCTVGLGGHAAAISDRIGPTGTAVLFDLDINHLDYSRQRLESLARPPTIITHHASFAEAPRLLARSGIVADLLLADLGFASPQVDNPERGFSFSRDGPLDMRLNPQAPITAQELVNTLPERELAELIRDYAEEPWPVAMRIAGKIVSERRDNPITRTAQLASIVRSALPPRRPGPSIDPATTTFQALRIAVNDELGSLRTLLAGIERAASGASSFLKTAPGHGARVGIISFHSLEDRPVKRSFASLTERALATELTRKPVIADEAELAANPRARSAKLRAIRLGSGGA
jgi:16S rRNA (cytosine1402-N4)-methyltransferase